MNYSGELKRFSLRSLSQVLYVISIISNPNNSKLCNYVYTSEVIISLILLILIIVTVYWSSLAY